MPAAPLVWLVTGCSSGFGQEFIKQILARGDKAIATARKLESIEKLANLGAVTLQLDVTAPVSELEGKIKEAVGFYGRVDVLVANAGYVHYGPIEESEYVCHIHYALPSPNHSFSRQSPSDVLTRLASQF